MTKEEQREYWRKREEEAKSRDYSASAIEKRFANGSWDEYDTRYIVAKLRQMEMESK